MRLLQLPTHVRFNFRPRTEMRRSKWQRKRRSKFKKQHVRRPFCTTRLCGLCTHSSYLLHHLDYQYYLFDLHCDSHGCFKCFFFLFAILMVLALSSKVCQKLLFTIFNGWQRPVRLQQQALNGTAKFSVQRSTAKCEGFLCIRYTTQAVGSTHLSPLACTTTMRWSRGTSPWCS